MMSDLTSLSSTMLYTAFAFYSIATVIFGITVTDKNKQKKKGKMGAVAISITITGLVAQLVYFITRWIAGGHAPVSNMFEFMTSLGMGIVIAFIIIYFIYRLYILGLFSLPVSLILIVYVSIFANYLLHFQTPFKFLFYLLY